MQGNSATLDCLEQSVSASTLPFIFNPNHLNITRHLPLKSWSTPPHSSPNIPAYHSTIIRVHSHSDRTGHNLTFPITLGGDVGRVFSRVFSVLPCHAQSLPLLTPLHFHSCLGYTPKHGLSRIWFKIIKQGPKFQVHRETKRVSSGSIVQVECCSNYAVKLRIMNS